MNTAKNLKPIRRWALAAVAGNVALAVAAAVVLPAEAVALLPVLALGLPLLTTAVLDAALARQLGQH